MLRNLNSACPVVWIAWCLATQSTAAQLPSGQTSEPAFAAAPTDDPDDALTSLLSMETQLQESLPRLIPAIIAIEGGGSGVIVSPDGLILSAAHVMAGRTTTVDVRLASGVVWKARQLGRDLQQDLALLKLAGSRTNWPFVPMADSHSLQTGQWCACLGYPKYFQRGAPAAVRIGFTSQVTETRITTDCSIMGGDSGGALVSPDGKLLAINSRITTVRSQNYHLPIDLFRKRWPELPQPPHSPVDADAGDRPHTSSSRELQNGLKEIASPSVASVVTLGSPSGSLSLATVVSESGLAMTKLGQFEEPSVWLDGETRNPIRVVRVDRDLDLALIQLSGRETWTPIAFPRAENPVQPGQLVSSLVAASDGVVGSSQLGVVAVAPRRFGERSSEGKLKAQADAPEVDFPEDSPWGGGPLSKVRFINGQVIVHDCPIEPGSCGGPLIGLQGEVLGINIARATRVATLAVPISVVQQFLVRALEELEPRNVPDPGSPGNNSKNRP